MPTPCLLAMWHEICKWWDRELITTEELKFYACLFFNDDVLHDVLEEIDVADLCVA